MDFISSLSFALYRCVFILLLFVSYVVLACHGRDESVGNFPDKIRLYPTRFFSWYEMHTENCGLYYSSCGSNLWHLDQRLNTRVCSYWW